jgi:hypothetical protein
VEQAVQQFKDSVKTRKMLEDTLVYDNIEVADYESTRTLVFIQSLPMSEFQLIAVVSSLDRSP